MEIKKEEIFRVGHAAFPSEAEAQRYIDSQEKNTSVVLANIDALKSSPFTAVPVLVDEDLDFFDRKADYETLSVLGRKLGNLSERFSVLTPVEVLSVLGKQDLSISSDVFQEFVENLMFFNDAAGKEKMDWRELLKNVSEIHISPEYLHCD